jgi:hypothetical protein
MVDKTNLELEITIPNLAEAIEAISSDIELSQSLNLSVISEDFSKLSKFIETESIDITKVQETLRHITALKDIADFKPLQVDITNPNAISNTVTALSFGFILTAIITTLIVMNICCPQFTACLFKPFLKCAECLGDRCWKSCTNACSGTITGTPNHPPNPLLTILLAWKRHLQPQQCNFALPLKEKTTSLPPDLGNLCMNNYLHIPMILSALQDFLNFFLIALKCYMKKTGS